MKHSHRQTRSHLMTLFERHGFHPRTDLGQNFLIDLNLLDFLAREAWLDRYDVVLEIGAGTGGLTTLLAEQSAAVISVEVDTNMYALASEVVKPFDNVTLLNCDALKNKNCLEPRVIEEVQRQLAAAPNRSLKLVANLPYNIATPIVSNLVATDLPWSRMIVTIQLELGRRMAAGPGSSDYGALSVWLQSQCDVKILKRMKPTVFWPRPGVESAIVRLLPNADRRHEIGDRAFFHDFVRRLFHLRRKLLRVVLAGMYRKQLTKPEIDAVLQTMDLGDRNRAEQLEPAELVVLSSRIREVVNVS